jgi:hypothetical protein
MPLPDWYQTTAAWTTCTPVTNNEIWTTWTGATSYTVTNSTAITVDTTWNGWVVENTPRRLRRTEDWYAQTLPTLDAARQQQETRLRQREEIDRHFREAEERALELLHSCLTENQRLDLEADDQFTVVAPSGREYLIVQGYAGNVYSEGWSFCIHMDSRLPVSDHMLAQKLMIETDEAGFLSIANRSPGGVAA